MISQHIDYLYREYLGTLILIYIYLYIIHCVRVCFYLFYFIFNLLLRPHGAQQYHPAF